MLKRLHSSSRQNQDLNLRLPEVPEPRLLGTLLSWLLCGLEESYFTLLDTPLPPMIFPGYRFRPIGVIYKRPCVQREKRSEQVAPSRRAFWRRWTSGGRVEVDAGNQGGGHSG